MTNALDRNAFKGVYLLRPFKLAIFSIQFVDKDNLLGRTEHTMKIY